jgi:hypothetical protein
MKNIQNKTPFHMGGEFSNRPIVYGTRDAKQYCKILNKTPGKVYY